MTSSSGAASPIANSSAMKSGLPMGMAIGLPEASMS
eukprot:CAMPEP_0179072610 /NCGR_PEP_ID=MMETSP0796-20121207/32146_1 /TAXON_ID=73915 /ORGANISM="Pyrodinium bahamense, Strain pbaha01" /LENGTH=35 /DNA_ID= /DNA_START= /DNA_END= /DNA_ORIENTATION=